MFRENLKFKIDCKGLMIKELAAVTGISKRTIDTYVDNRAVIPNAEIAVKLAKALDTSVEYLVTGSDSNVTSSFSNEAYEDYRRHKKTIDALNTLPDDLLPVVSDIIQEIAKRYGKTPRR